MTTQRPRVSIGLPVYNGERYLAQALDSLLAQTFQDYELIICDNCSSDATEDICTAYAARDRRIRYYRSEQNRGLAWNFNRTFELASGEYFKWAGHDDLWAPQLLERCIEALDSRPDVVLAHPRLATIDEHGQVIERYDVSLRTDAARPHERFYAMIRTWHRHIQTHGLFRVSALQMTPLIGNYSDSDVALLARLSLLGRIYEVPEHLVFYRYHSHQSMQLRRIERSILFDPRHQGKIIFPEWRLFYELFLSAWQVSLPWSERVLCLLSLLCWPTWEPHWHRLGKDVVRAAIAIVALSLKPLRSPVAAHTARR